MNKYVFGSTMLGVDRPRDVDELTFVDKRPGDISAMNERSIPFYKMLIQHFIDGKSKPDSDFISLYFYQLSAPFIKEDDYPFSYFNILDYKGIWVKQLKGYINLPDTEIKATEREILPKKYYHLLYQYQMLKENTHRISDVAMADVQRIHDLEMPSAYFSELKALINSLEEEYEI